MSGLGKILGTAALTAGAFFVSGPVGAGAVLLGSSVSNQMKGQDYAEKAAAAQRRIERAQAAEDRRARIRQAIIANSSVLNTAANTGTIGSSGALGASASVASQVGSAVAFSKFTERLSTKVGTYQQKASDYNVNAQIGMDLFNVGVALNR